MSTTQIARDIIWGDCLKVILIEPHTGAYEVVKSLADPTGAEERIAQEKNVFAYAERMADESLIHPDDVYRYLVVLRGMMPGEEGVSCLTEGKRLRRHLRYRIGNRYIWTSFEIIFPIGYPDKAKSCVFCIRRADDSVDNKDANLAEMADVVSEFDKVLKINIVDDSFKVIKLPAESLVIPQDQHVSSWFKAFAAARRVHPDDMNVFNEFTNIDRMRSSFAESTDPQRCKYRRSVGDSWRWVVMSLVPAIEYTDDNKILMLYVRDMDDATQITAETHRHESKMAERDELTGLKTLRELENDISELESRGDIDGVGVLASSLNGLAFTIANESAHAGDDRLREFAGMLTDMFSAGRCYRINIDEFVVIYPDVSSAAFNRWAGLFRTKSRFTTPPTAAVGYAWDSKPESISDLLRRAELAMSADKSEFIKNFPERAYDMDVVQ